MKRVIALFLFVMMVFSLVACGNEDSATVDNNTAGSNNNVNNTNDTSLSVDYLKSAKETDVNLFEYYDYDDGVSITKFTGDDEIVVIPEKIEGIDVVSIEKGAFSNNHTIKGIKISDKVHTIGENAFINCYDLEVAVFGSSVKTVGDCAFSYCEKLHSVELNDGLEILDVGCFLGTDISEIEIPSSVTEIYTAFLPDTDESITIIGESGSAAEQYVKELEKNYDLKFQTK